MIAFAALAPIAMKVAGPMIAQMAGPLLGKLAGGLFGGNQTAANPGQTLMGNGGGLNISNPLQMANPTQMLSRGVPGLNGGNSILSGIFNS